MFWGLFAINLMENILKKQIMKQNRPVSYFNSTLDCILIMFLKLNLPHNP